MSERSEVIFTKARPVAAEGERVGIVTCETCGAALLLDPADEFDVLEVHRAWHEGMSDA